MKKDKITTYVINLPSSEVRRKYMENLLSPYTFLDVCFVKAIWGKGLTEEQLACLFDEKESQQHYGRALNRGEIGVTLSHRLCYNQLLSSSDECALIMEDDVHPMRDLSELKSLPLDNILKNDKPRVLLLSGDFWYFHRKNKVAHVYNAVGAYAYLINRKAAERILSIERPYNVADDWTLFRQLGISLRAVSPYLVDANVNMEELGSDVSQDNWGINRKFIPWRERLFSYVDAIVRKVLKGLRHFEPKIRIINNVIVDQ